MDLPAEIWVQIFNLAADDDLIFQYGLQTSFSVHAWWKAFHGDWLLRSPREALNYIQKRSYFTKKAIVSTCRTWRGIGSESLFRYLFFDHPSKLLALCSVLQSGSAVSTTISSSLGWWTRRVHLANRDHRGGITMADLENSLLLVMKHCPNLEFFVVDWPMGSTFGPVADTLAYQASRSLRTVHWQVSREALPKVIWALDSLPYLVAAHIHFAFSTSTSTDDDDNQSDFGSVKLGAASNVHLNLRYLQQLSLKGHFQQFLEQATGWSLRALQSLSLDFGNNSNELPDVISFLQQHGSTLLFLDIKCIPLLDVSKILDSCPRLTTFAFNADWRIMPNDGTASELVRVPHFNISTIGLHGLSYAFGVGYGAAHAQGAPITAQIIRKSNDMNVAALNKMNFPKLECVRILSPAVLRDLERENGPSQREGGVQRYDTWWNTLSRSGIRLEDCTGAPLGTLPQNDDDEDSEGEEEDLSDSDTSEVGYESADETFTLDDVEEEEEDVEEEDGVENELDPAKKHVTELHRLLEECRAMEQTREELPYASMMSMGTSASRYSREVDYGMLYQQFTGNGDASDAPSGSSGSASTPAGQRSDQGTTFGFGSRDGGKRPRVSFGISDTPPPLDETRGPVRSSNSSRRSSARHPSSQLRRSSSQYAPSESDLGTLVGFPGDSPAISSNATLVADDGSDDDYRYEYDDEDYDDDEYDEDYEDGEEDDEEEDKHPVATLRKLLEECRAMREAREEPLFNPMMFGGPMGMGFGMAPYPASQYPPATPRNSYYTNSNSNHAPSSSSARR